MTVQSLWPKVVSKRKQRKKDKTNLWPNHYRNSLTGKEYQPHNDRVGFFVMSDSPRYMLLKGGEGAGKGLPLNTVVPTPSGYTCIESIKLGDFVFDENGNCAKVLRVHGPFNRDCYKITFDTGETIVADEDHLWQVESYAYRKNIVRRGTIRPYHTQAVHHLQVLNTKQIFDTQNDCYKNRSNYSIPLALPLNLPSQKLLIDPYMLGAWLGDGHSVGARITIGKSDQCDMIKIIESLGYKLSIQKDKTCFGIDTHFSTNRDIKGRMVSSPNSFSFKLKSLNLIKNKHIPNQYMRGSIKQRLSLLQGLMDTDGTIDKKGRCEFCSVNESLANQVVELCLSLGIKAVSKKGRVKYKGDYRTRYRISFTPNIMVFRLNRKRKRIHLENNKNQQIRKQRRYIVKVELVDSVPTKCIEVDSPNHLFLATKGLIPTHNSASGIVKALEKIKRGEPGIVVSPDFEHFKKSLWPEFKRWIPWQCVIDKHQYRKEPGHEPGKPFTLTFINQFGKYTDVIFGGAKETEIESWRGPNVNWVYLDEISRHNLPVAIKLFDGRIRIGDLPCQIFMTTTPKKNWLFEMFAGAKGDEDSLHLVPIETQKIYQDFRKDAYVITASTLENELAGNLESGFTAKRAQSLNEAERRIYLEAAWEDESDIEKFVNLIWWDNCAESIPPLDRHTPIVIALDAAKGGETNIPDCFAVVAVSRHPSNGENVAVRYCGIYQPSPSQLMDFAPIEQEIRRLCREFSVLEIAYDPYQLHDMCMRFRSEGVANVKEFSQGMDRLKADKQLQDLITSRRIAHDGNPLLRQHIDNANIKKSGQDGIRLIKRNTSQKIDAAVALSMAASRILYYNL